MEGVRLFQLAARVALPIRRLWIAALGIACLCCFLDARACDTPVYRFAMYNWRYVAPYQVFYMYRGQPDEADRAANETLEALAANLPAAANVTLTSVNVDDEAELESLPGVVREAWRNLPKTSQPVHLIFTPHGTLLDAKRLDVQEVRALVDSPGRTKLSQLLQQGHAGVLIVLTGASDEENSAVEEVVTEVIRRGAAGEIVPFSLIPPVDDAADLDLQTDDAAPDVGRLTVRRDDPDERWFVRMLLHVEADLAEDQRPMVFPAYGRGRVMEPYLAGGVTVENLSEAVAFVTGACSCEVKEQNPGMDLLTHWDWEAAAQAVAERYGAEEGNEHLLDQGNLFPSILIAADETADIDGPASENSAPVELTTEDDLDAGGDGSILPAETEGPDAENGALSQPVSASPATDSPLGSSFSTTLSRNLGVLAAIACVALALTGFFLMRPRN